MLITEPHKLGNHARTEKDVYEDIQNPEARNLNSKINVCVYCIYIYTQQLKIEFQADNLGGAHWRLAAQSEVQLSKKNGKGDPQRPPGEEKRPQLLPKFTHHPNWVLLEGPSQDPYKPAAGRIVFRMCQERRSRASAAFLSKADQEPRFGRIPCGSKIDLTLGWERHIRGDPPVAAVNFNKCFLASALAIFKRKVYSLPQAP